MAVMMAVMMAPVPTAGSLIAVGAGSHDDRGGSVHHGRGGDHHRSRGNEDRDRQPDTYGHMHPGVGWTRQEKECDSHAGAQTHDPQ
jgi:hypothetical protein